MSKLDWKSGPIPDGGFYATKLPGRGNASAKVRYQTNNENEYLWIGPLPENLPEKAPEPPAPDWGRGPVPAYGDYLVYVPERTPTLRSCLKGGMPRGGALDQERDWWYGPIPGRPAEEPAEANEWADLAREERCRLATLERRVEEQDQLLSRLCAILDRIRHELGGCRLPEELHPLRDVLHEALS